MIVFRLGIQTKMQRLRKMTLELPYQLRAAPSAVMEESPNWPRMESLSVFAGIAVGKDMFPHNALVRLHLQMADWTKGSHPRRMTSATSAPLADMTILLMPPWLLKWTASGLRSSSRISMIIMSVLQTVSRVSSMSHGTTFLDI